jgi:mannose-6-phosphate isomerase
LVLKPNHLGKLNNKDMKYDQPLLFEPNRVWRLYTGGMLLDEFTGTKDGMEAHFPEDWLASTVLANNGEHSQAPDEGLAKVITNGNASVSLQYILTSNGASILGSKHYSKYGANTAVLCKYLDSAVRLPIQCHPDAATARKLFNSPFGKTECWHIISTRRINGEEPYILLGFKENINPEKFKKAVYDQDIPAMMDMLHKIPAKAGETYFVPGRIPHAIGPGVFMLEVQEPSDWVIQPEPYCVDIKLSHSDMWGILQPEQGLEVFDYTGLSQKKLAEKTDPSNRVLFESDGLKIIELIGSGQTSAFSLWKVFIRGKVQIPIPSEFAIMVVEKGSGTIEWPGGSRPLKQSDYFLKPSDLKKMEIISNDQLELLVCLPPIVN